MIQPPHAIEVHGLRKSYGKDQVLKGIDLTVEPGSVLALLGPNGAGKTTLVRILATLLKHDEGSVKVYGYDVVREADLVRAQIGFTGQFTAVDENMSGQENIVLAARLLGYSWGQAKDRAEELLALFDLTKAGYRLASTYSGGMQRRLDIAISLIAAPKLLFLDEPTTGLDPRGRKQVWEILHGMVKQGTTIVLTTQYLEEADRLAQHIAVIDKGVIIASDTPAKLKASVGNGAVHVRTDNGHDKRRVQQLLEKRLGLEVHDMPHQLGISATVPSAGVAVAAMQQLLEAGVTPTDFSYAQPSLDEVFMTLTGHAAEATSNQIEETTDVSE